MRALVLLWGCPVEADGHDPLGTHHTHRQQISGRGFITLGVTPQRVRAAALHVEHQPTRSRYLHYRLYALAILDELRAPPRRRTKLSFYRFQLTVHGLPSPPEHFAGSEPPFPKTQPATAM